MFPFLDCCFANAQICDIENLVANITDYGRNSKGILRLTAQSHIWHFEIDTDLLI